MTVSDIQRWDFFGEVGINEPVRYLHLEAVQGRYVTYADHVAAVAAAEQRVRDEFMDSTPELTAYRKQQYAAGVKAARDAVAAHIRADLTGQEMFCGRKRGILAAIDALISGKIGESDE